jgi:hypothetical protein
MMELTRAEVALLMNALNFYTSDTDLLGRIEQVLEKYPDETVFVLESKQALEQAKAAQFPNEAHP